MYIHRRNFIIPMIDDLSGIYVEYQQKRSKYQQVLRYRSDLTTKMLKITSLLYIFTVSMVVCYPLVHWLRYREKIFIMQFLLPGIDDTTDLGYTIHIFSHICCMSLGGFGNFAGDMVMFLLIIHIPLLKDILELKFDDLNEIIAETHNPLKTLPLLQDIIAWHQRYNR